MGGNIWGNCNCKSGFFVPYLQWVICLDSQPAHAQPLFESWSTFTGMESTPLHICTHSMVLKMVSKQRHHGERCAACYQSAPQNPHPNPLNLS